MSPLRRTFGSWVWGVALVGFSNCSKENKATQPPSPLPAVVEQQGLKGCAPNSLKTGLGSQGDANAFIVDPASASGNSLLSPSDSHLDDYAKRVALSNLSGEGILRGRYVAVINEKYCKSGFGAYSSKNEFIFNHSDWHFQEAMSYFLGDLFRASLDQIPGGLPAKGAIRVLAHCVDDDNAYFVRSGSGGASSEYVCLGDSSMTAGASYADDGTVLVHELQHGTTVDTYSPIVSLNQLLYDEAGAINEGISDFVGLIVADRLTQSKSALDPRVFSRWALSTYNPNYSGARGANRCPQYDTHYPECDEFPAFHPPRIENKFSTAISYSYPDGLGWPYANNYTGLSSAKQAWSRFASQEEIHANNIIVQGALWDIYRGLLSAHGGDRDFAFQKSIQLTLEAVRHLPMPDQKLNRSPVSMIELAAQLVANAPLIEGLRESDVDQIKKVLTERGLYEFERIQGSDWLALGPGKSKDIASPATPGAYILDDPHVLKSWASKFGKPGSFVPQALGTGLNSKLDPGEIAVVWFDLQNKSKVTAGGVIVTVTSSDPDVTLLDDSLNFGALSLSNTNQVQVLYSKINGKGIVEKFNSASDQENPVPLGNTYFMTNPHFYKTYRTGIWLSVNPNTAHGKVIELSVSAKPTNGDLATIPVSVTIQ